MCGSTRVTRRLGRYRVAAAAGIALVAATAAAQSRIDLPVEASLETPRIEIDLVDARVVVTIDDRRRPRLAARAADPDRPGTVALEGTVTPGAVSKVRRFDDGSPLAPIVVEIDVTSEQVVVISGSTLDLAVVRVETGPAPAPTAEPEPADGPIPGVSLAVTDSDLRATGLAGLGLRAERTVVDLDSVVDPLVIELIESELHARNAAGAATIDATDSKITLEAWTGPVTVTLDGGSLDAAGGALELRGTAARADVSLDGVAGQVQLTGSDSSVRVTNLPGLPVRLSGTDLEVALAEVGGPVRVDLSGGTVRIDSVADRVDLQLKAGAEADVRALRGDLAVLAAEGARARIESVAGHTRVRLDDGELELADLKSLQLHAVDGFVTGFDIRNLTKVEAADSTLDITIPGGAGRHQLTLSGRTDAYIRLPTPCRVTAKMPDTTEGERLRVGGCLLDFDGSVKRGLQRGIDGKAPARLNATLDDVATLEVDGVP